MTIQSQATVLAAIAALAPGSMLATDADETLWRGDIGDEVVRRAATAPFDPWKSGDADFVWYQAELARDYINACRYSAEVVVRADPQAVRPVMAAVVREHLRPRRWLVAALRAAQARGVHVVIVSASPRLAVEAGAALFGLDACPIIAVDCLQADPAAFNEPVPIGDGKVAAWTVQNLPPPDLALGDSKWDGPLLRSARRGLLLQRACEDPQCDLEPTPI